MACSQRRLRLRKVSVREFAVSFRRVPKRLHWFLAGPMVDGQMFGDNSEKTKPQSGSMRVL